MASFLFISPPVLFLFLYYLPCLVVVVVVRQWEMMVHAFQAIAYIQNSRVTGDHIPPTTRPTLQVKQKGKWEKTRRSSSTQKNNNKTHTTNRRKVIFFF
jgi:hypothetical protein